MLFLLHGREEWYRGDGEGDLYVLRVGDVLIGDDERDLYGEIDWRDENLRKFDLDEELWIGVLNLCEE